MRRPEVRTVVLMTFLLVVTCAGIPGFGQCGERNPSGAGQRQTRWNFRPGMLYLFSKQAIPIASSCLSARYPRLPEAILTTDGVRQPGIRRGHRQHGHASYPPRGRGAAGRPGQARRTALYLAVANAHEAAASLLIAAGANVRPARPDRVSHPCIWPQSVVCRRLSSDLLSHGAVVDARTARGTTPLAMAAYFGHLSVVRLLGEGAADINHADVDGVTALHCAAQSKKPEVVRYLLGKGASADAKDSAGKTPADWARQAGDREIEGLLTGKASKP